MGKKSGNFPLHLARSEEEAQLLMEYGADPTKQDANGKTPRENWQEITADFAKARGGLRRRLDAGVPDSDSDPEAEIHDSEVDAYNAQAMTVFFEKAEQDWAAKKGCRPSR